MRCGISRVTHLKDLKAGDVQHSDKELAWQNGVQRPIYTPHQPLEHVVISGFGQSSHGIVNLVEPHNVCGTHEDHSCHSHGLQQLPGYQADLSGCFIPCILVDQQ